MKIDVRGKGWEILKHGAPLGELVTEENLPCCTFCAMWVLELLYDIEGEHMNDYYRYDAGWWEQANVYDREHAWSALTAIKEKMGGTMEYCEEVKKEAPGLTAGRWHVIQRWSGLELQKTGWEDDQVVDKQSRGHTYLAYMGMDGVVYIAQSSLRHGYRVDSGSWVGDAGLRGHSVGVLTLPKFV